MNACQHCFVVSCIVFISTFFATAVASAFQDVQIQSPNDFPSQSPTRLPSETDADSGKSQTSSQPVEENMEKDASSNDRLFWTLPNFLMVENSKKVPPLGSGAKFKLVLRTSFDWVEFPYIGFLAGVGQAQNSESGYGQGSAGYVKRFASSFADSTDENFWTGAILPSVFHQDPRYFQLGKGGFFRRVGYAVTRQLITRNDSGRTEFNISEVAGSGISAAISNIYHPADDRAFGNTLSVWWTQIGWDTVANVVKEFWPDIRRGFTKHTNAL